MMNQVFSSQFLIIFFAVVNVFLMLLLWIVIRRINRLHGQMVSMSLTSREDESFDSAQTGQNTKAVMEKSAEILEMLESLVAEAKNAAENFEEQIQEKRHLSKTLNDALDSRIISINLLLSRAKTLHEKLERQQDKLIDQVGSLEPQGVSQAQVSRGNRINVIDQQQQILDLYYRKKDVDSIAQALSLPREEVRMVIELKEKFIAMEKTR